MPEYRIKWEIEDISEGSPLEAARIAQQIQGDPESIASVFLIQPMYADENGDDWTEIDLSKE